MMRRIIRWAAIAAVVLFVLTVGALAGMEYYTGRSEFCGSCHIMRPYYKSWQRDVHGTKAAADCVDCHYPPGERHTPHAKLRGLSQMVSYVSGRTGGARPRPRVRDESCLRSGCHHEDDFMKAVYPIRDVRFNHGKHLKSDPVEIEKNAVRLKTLTDRLKAELGEGLFEELQQLAILVGNPEHVQQKVSHLVRMTGKKHDLADQAIDYAQAVHRDIRLKQLNNLRCATCHIYSGGEKHFSVQRETCFLCHFANEAFNTGTGECLKCHEPPVVSLPTHGGAVKVTPGMTTTAATGKMDHAVIIANNVDCVSCHADLIKGTAVVDRQQCESCHDLPRYFEEFDGDLNTTLVAALHQTHTSNLHALCADCHDPIEHQLGPKHLALAGEGFLEPIRTNCVHCHPNHHQAQVAMLAGKGPDAVPSGAANAMFGSRVNCLGCHVSAGEGAKGLTVVKATKQACVVCHSQDYEQLFDQWLSRLAAGIKDVKHLESQAAKQLAAVGDDRPAARREAQATLAKGRAALAFVEQAEGIHNRNYALELLDYASEQFARTIETLGGPTTTRAAMRRRAE